MAGLAGGLNLKIRRVGRGVDAEPRPTGKFARHTMGVRRPDAGPTFFSSTQACMPPVL